MRDYVIIAVSTLVFFGIPFFEPLVHHEDVWNQLKDWQTLMTGVLALAGAIIAFISIMLQIEAGEKAAQERVREEKSRAVGALAVELTHVRDLIVQLQARLDEDTYETRAFHKSLPSDFPVFDSQKNGLGRLNKETALLVYRAYSILRNVSREIALDAEHEPTRPIHYDPDGWPGSELNQFCDAALEAIRALEKERF